MAANRIGQKQSDSYMAQPACNGLGSVALYFRLRMFTFAPKDHDNGVDETARNWAGSSNRTPTGERLSGSITAWTQVSKATCS